MRIYSIPRCWTLRNQFRPIPRTLSLLNIWGLIDHDRVPSILRLPGIHWRRNYSEFLRMPCNSGIGWKWFRNIQHCGIGWLLKNKFLDRLLFIGMNQMLYLIYTMMIFRIKLSKDFSDFIIISTSLLHILIDLFIR